MEQIILAPGINGNELLRCLAMHGKNCFNVRVCSASNLARLALMRSGIPIKENFVSSQEAAAIIAEAVKAVKAAEEAKAAKNTETGENEEAGEKAGTGNDKEKDKFYFDKTTYSDIRAITNAVYRMRSLVPGGKVEDEAKAIQNALENGEFKKKNNALLVVYREYMRILAEKQAIDSVSVIRKAIAECKPMDAEFVFLEEYPLNPLEKSLFEVLSGKKIDECKPRKMEELFIDTEQKQPAKEKLTESLPYRYNIKSFKNCYGAANEVETILEDIYKDKSPDKCTVAVTDTVTYGQLFFDYSLLYNIPVTFGCGIPITNSNPAKLLFLYHHWISDGFYGVDALREMLFSNAFNRQELYEKLQLPEDMRSKFWNFCEIVGKLRLSANKDKNSKRIADFKTAIEEEESLLDPQDDKERKIVEWKKQCIPYLVTLSEELSLNAEEFISRYANIRIRDYNEEDYAEKLLSMLDKVAAKQIYEEMKIIRETGMNSEQDDIIQSILKMTVCRQGSEGGKLHVTNLSGAAASLREYLYIAGLSASKYPGSPKENYLLLDDDLKAFATKDAELYTSSGIITRKEETVKQLVHLAACMDVETNVSYSGLNVSELKKDNKSSLVFKLYNGNNVKNKKNEPEKWEDDIRKVKYFEPAISVTRKIGAAYNGDEDNKEKNIIPSAQNARPAVTVQGDLSKEYSPTALERFFACPRRFMLQTVLEIPEPEENDSFEVITARDKGTIAHSLMAQLANSKMTSAEFRDLAGEFFDRYVKMNTPLVRDSATVVRQQFLDMMETAYRQDPQMETVMTEQELKCQHKETGIWLKGRSDRVEKLHDGTCQIVDFKTGKVIEEVDYETGKSTKQKKDDINTCLQVILYAYIMENKDSNPVKISKGEYRYIRENEIISCNYNDRMKEDLSEKLKKFKEHILIGNYPTAMGDKACEYCKFGNICGKSM